MVGPFQDPENAHGQSRDRPKSWKCAQHWHYISGERQNGGLSVQSRPAVAKSTIHKSYIDKLEKVQKRTTKIIPELRKNALSWQTEAVESAHCDL